MGGINKETSCVLISLYTPFYKIKKEIINKYNLIIIENILDKKQDGNTVLMFNDLNVFLGSLINITKPPILKLSIEDIKKLNFSFEVKFIDFNLMSDGLIKIIDLKVNTLNKMLDKDFKPFYNPKVCNNKIVDNESISSVFDDFIDTLPAYMKEPMLISIVTSIEDNNYDVLDKFISSNRLLTNINKSKYVKIAKFLTDNKNLIEFPYIRFLIKKFGIKDINTYIDSEDNVNSASIKI